MASPVTAIPAGITRERLTASPGPAGAGAAPRTPPSLRANALEWLEDAVLLLLIVLAVPVVILLLALPFALIIRIAGG
jgi:hypothetical protein